MYRFSLAEHLVGVFQSSINDWLLQGFLHMYIQFSGSDIVHYYWYK